MGPSMPHATPRNHQKVATMMKEMTPKTICFVRSERRREVKMKWSVRCENMSTEKYRVGS